MARRRKRNTPNPLLATVVVVAGVGGGYWYFGTHSAPDEPLGDDARTVPLTSDRPESAPLDGSPNGDVAERGEDPDLNRDRAASDVLRGRALLAAGRKAMEQGQLVAARAQLSEALQYDLPLQERVQLRADLTRLGRETFFAASITKDDPFVEAYLVQPGDTLDKIAKRYAITDDLIAWINGITNKNIIRVGQRLKVIQGPFHAVVSLDEFTLDVYLDNTFVLRFPVGLGADNSTPTGKWKVRNKLRNPTYYPPRGGKIIAADDPENPLAERWIGLEGIEGEAVGQQRYGLHGTIEPDSIGKNTSLGCIRLHNQDVEELFDLVVVNKSTITVR